MQIYYIPTQWSNIRGIVRKQIHTHCILIASEGRFKRHLNAAWNLKFNDLSSGDTKRQCKQLIVPTAAVRHDDSTFKAARLTNEPYLPCKHAHTNQYTHTASKSLYRSPTTRPHTHSVQQAIPAHQRLPDMSRQILLREMSRCDIRPRCSKPAYQHQLCKASSLHDDLYPVTSFITISFKAQCSFKDRAVKMHSPPQTATVVVCQSSGWNASTIGFDPAWWLNIAVVSDLITLDQRLRLDDNAEAFKWKWNVFIFLWNHTLALHEQSSTIVCFSSSLSPLFHVIFLMISFDLSLFRSWSLYHSALVWH